MRGGVLQFFSWSRRVPLTTVYERAFSRIEIMDQTGYDCVWLAEHHNPLRLAEEVAMIDVLSGGRVNWGAGRGFDRAEFDAFAVPVEESSDRFRECVEIVLPKPLQAPHPPVWLAATSPDSIRRAAEKGHDILQDPHATHADIGRKRAHYYEVLRAHGFPTEGRVIPTARLLAVGATDQEADEVARAGAAWTVASYANPTKRAGPPPAHWAPGADPVERYMNEVVIRGTPDRVTDKILELRETIGLDYLMCAPLSHASFTLFTDKVLPKLI